MATRRTFIVGLVAACLVVLLIPIVVVVIINVGDDIPNTPPPNRPESPIREDLLDRAEPDPACRTAQAPPALQPGQVYLSVIRLEGTCLVVQAQAVDSSAVEATLRDIRAGPDVVAADVVSARTPGDGQDEGSKDKSEKQWALEDLSSGEVAKLWPENAKEIRVAVIDTGIDQANQDLAGRVAEVRPITELGGGDYASHGTHVAGIIAANPEAPGVSGLTPAVRLLDDQYYRGEDWWGIPGVADDIIWSVDHGAQVINMSLGGAGTSADQEAAALYAERRGVVVVASAGNCGRDRRGRFKRPFKNYLNTKVCTVGKNQVGWPAAYDTVLAVGAYDDDGDVADFSTQNWTVDLAAPGADIVSSCRTDGTKTVSTCKKGGTSMAAPYVSATAALLKARQPYATPAAIREALTRSARPGKKQQQGQRNDAYGWGKLDPVAAAHYLDDHPQGADPPKDAEVPGDTIVAGFVTQHADGKMELRLGRADGASTIPVQTVEPVYAADSRMAFSPDGEWFASADGTALTIVNSHTAKQQTVACSCFGVTFNADNEIVTALSMKRDSGNPSKIIIIDPATGETVTSSEYADPGTNLGRARVLAVAGDLTILALRLLEPSGDSSSGPVQPENREETLIAVGPKGVVTTMGHSFAGFGAVAASADGRRLAYAAQQFCQHDTPLNLVDLQESRGKPSGGWGSQVIGPVERSMDGVVKSLRFEGDRLRVGWVATKTNGGPLCREKGDDALPDIWSMPVMSWDTARKATKPSWTKEIEGRADQVTLRNGEQLYLDGVPGKSWLSVLRRDLPGGADPVTVGDDILYAVVRPR